VLRLNDDPNRSRAALNPSRALVTVAGSYLSDPGPDRFVRRSCEMLSAAFQGHLRVQIDYAWTFSFEAIGLNLALNDGFDFFV
jgi:hypothetical protein